MKQEIDSQRELLFKRKVGGVYQCVKIEVPQLKYIMVKLDSIDFNVHDLQEFSEVEDDYKFLKRFIYRMFARYDIKSPLNTKLFVGYDAYLNSEQWAEKRRQTILYHGNKCKDCGDNAIDIHHLHYKTLYFENPKTDLIPLCRTCHAKRHGHD